MYNIIYVILSFYYSGTVGGSTLTTNDDDDDDDDSGGGGGLTHSPLNDKTLMLSLAVGMMSFLYRLYPPRTDLCLC